MDFRYPSDTFPGPPAFALTLPDGWEPFSSAAAAICASDPASPEHFRSNVVVVLTKVVHDHPAAEVADLLVAKTQADYPGAEVVQAETATVAGLEAELRLLTFQPEHADFPVAQLQGVLVVPTSDPDVRYALQFHGTTAADGLGTYEPVFRDCFGSIRLS